MTVDIRFRATNPVSQVWHVEGLTPFGKHIVEGKYPAGKIHGAMWLARFKTGLASVGATHETVFPNAVETVIE